LCGMFLFGIPALICALLSFGDISRSKGRVGGRGLAITAIVLACFGSCIEPIAILPFAVGFPAIEKVPQAARNVKSKNNLRQIGIAMNNCDAQSGQLPPGAIYSKDGKPLLSWRVALLPYLESGDPTLYGRFHLDEPWDSPHNIKLLNEMPAVYRAPTDEP